jgi:beta-alanine--pyruvate transaminase
MYYETVDGRQILDAMAGLWCVNAGHAQPHVIEAIQRQAAELDFVSSFQMSHPLAFHFAERLAAIAPSDLVHAFFTTSGSEAVDTALKIARGYHRARGDAARFRFIGRAKAYHGMGWGGLSVGGIGRHRRDFGPLLPGVDHLRHPYDRSRSAFSRGQPEHGLEYADELTTLLELHDPSTVAAVIVEPVAGSGGVFPPPKGYLQRLREICSRHGILLIFDEVITAFGRLGRAFASQAFDVTPDLITCAKGLTNGAAPMGAVLASTSVYDAFMQGPENMIELFHGYTYSAHPLSCAAGLATLEVYDELGLYDRAAQLAPIWEGAIHSLRDGPGVIDIRNLGLLGAIDLESRPGEPGARARACSDLCFERGVLVRSSGDTLIVSPPLIITEEQIADVFETVAEAIAGTR